MLLTAEASPFATAAMNSAFTDSIAAATSAELSTCCALLQPILKLITNSAHVLERKILIADRRRLEGLRVT